MTIPESSFADFAGIYFGIMDSHGDRPDKGDRGAEYRSLIGIPGGIDSPLYETLKEVSDGLVDLPAGAGDDADTLYKKKVWIMDIDKFPFY